MIVVTDPKLLAGAMRSIESGCTVEVPPTTRAGRPVHVDYQPTVGVVFYTQELGVPQLMAAVARELAAYAPQGRIVATSPATLVRVPPDATPPATVVHPVRRACYTTTPDPTPGLSLPARLLMQTLEPELPRHYSMRAGFTWVFTLVTAIADVPPFETMAEVNAAVASVLFDPDRVLPFGAGTEILSPADLFPSHGLSVALRRLGSFLVGVEPAGAKYTLEMVGDYRRLLPGSDRAPDLEFMEAGEAIDLACSECYAPVGGVAVMTLPGAATRRGASATYMCTHCWNAKKHFDPENCRLTILPPQAVAAAALAAASGAPEAAMAARLLAGAIAPIAGAPGAYLVACEGGPVILAAEELGRHPELTVPAVRNMCKRAPVVMSHQRIATAALE